MNIKIPSQILLKHLNAISSVIIANPVVPILENYLFEISPSELRITASDMNNSMVTVIPDIKVNETLKIAIPAKKLLETLRNLPESTITISIDMETYGIEITSDTGKYKLTGENAEDFPKVPTVEQSNSMIIPSGVLSSAISSTLFATSNDELRIAMTGVFIDIKADGITFVSTDGHRLAKYKRTDITNQVEHNLILPQKVLNLLKSNLPSENINVRFDFNPNHACLSFNDLQVTCKVIDEKYPDYQSVIPLDNNNMMTINRLEIASCLKRILIYSNQTTYKVRFNITGNQLMISTEDFEFSNEANERLKCDHRGQDLVLSFNSKLMVDTINNIVGEEVTFAFADNNSSKGVLISPTEQNDNEHVVMLAMPVVD